LSTEDGSLTVFVPTNAAFEALEGNEDFDFSPLTSKQSIYVLMYHVIIAEENALYYKDLECGGLTRTANRQTVRPKCDQGAKFQRGSKQLEDKIPEIILRDIEICNGVIHGVDNVIWPNLDRLYS